MNEVSVQTLSDKLLYFSLGISVISMGLFFAHHSISTLLLIYSGIQANTDIIRVVSTLGFELLAAPFCIILGVILAIKNIWCPPIVGRHLKTIVYIAIAFGLSAPIAGLATDKIIRNTLNKHAYSFCGYSNVKAKTSTSVWVSNRVHQCSRTIKTRYR